jgi:hypothetical protein
MAKYKEPRRPAPLEAVLRELESILAWDKEHSDSEAETSTYRQGMQAGYEYGMKRAIEIVNHEIGIRQDPPNIFYGRFRIHRPADGKEKKDE